LFYYDRYNKLQGGLAKDVQDGGLYVSTTNDGNDFEIYNLDTPQNGIKR
jgi:outer membrane protein assembly factor BamB